MTLAHAIASILASLAIGIIVGYAFRGRENKMIAHMGSIGSTEASKIAKKL